MKKLIVLAAAVLFTMNIFAMKKETVNEKVLQAFEQAFKNASDVIWHEGKDGYEVKFKHNAIDSRVSYDQEGNILRTIRYYGEEQLPLLVRAKLQKQYAGQKVFGVTELSAEGVLDYYIVLEDETTWRHVKCNSTGDMQTYKKYRKA
jgi:S-adenosylhomocysteine hydrolase